MNDIALFATAFTLGSVAGVWLTLHRIIHRNGRDADRKDKPLYWNQTAESAEARWNGGKS